jgi:outer membrane protein
MDVLRDAALLEVQSSNVRMLDEILRQTRERFKHGEITRTDVAQAEAQLAGGQSQMLRAESTLTTSKATYHRVIGSKPGPLEPGSPVDRLCPPTLAAAIKVGITANPSVRAAMYGVDVARLQVKISEGALYPTVALRANAELAHENDVTGLISDQSSFSVLVGATIPLYQGGAEYSKIRESKETLTQRRLDLATTRDQARAAVVQVWGQLQAAQAQVRAAQEQVKAAEVALKGVRMEARHGLRTTLDVLIDQQALVNAKVNLLTAQHDSIVGSYSLLGAIGGLSPQTLSLPTSIYDPTVHYQQVRDAWWGARTPDGQ